MGGITVSLYLNENIVFLRSLKSKTEHSSRDRGMLLICYGFRPKKRMVRAILLTSHKLKI